MTQNGTFARLSHKVDLYTWQHVETRSLCHILHLGCVEFVVSSLPGHELIMCS